MESLDLVQKETSPTQTEILELVSELSAGSGVLGSVL